LLGFFSKLMLTLSALAPVSLIYSYVAWTQSQFLVAQLSLLVALATVGTCLFVLHLAGNLATRTDFQSREIEAADGENVGFMLLYLLPLFTDEIASLNWQLWLPTLALLGVMIGNGYAHHFNPLLGLFGWHFYKATGESGIVFILITRKRLANAAAPLKVAQLTDNILFDLGGRI
jgi:hypothetical protein